LQDDGLIVETAPPDGTRETDARRRYYAVTPFGLAVAQAEAERLRELLRLAEARLPTAGRS
jgi:DNA-binding PadR family transcriptional regulator